MSNDIKKTAADAVDKVQAEAKKAAHKAEEVADKVQAEAKKAASKVQSEAKKAADKVQAEAKKVNDKLPVKATDRKRAERLIKDIGSINPATVKALAEAGYHSLQDLLKASSDRISSESKVALDKVKEVKAEAEKLAAHVAEGAKTSEGRKQLATEAKDVLVNTAKSAEAQVRDLIAKLQKDGEAAISKVADLKDKAPASVKDAQAKAESALGDAKAKLEELAKKTEEFAKAEFEKVKAANEGAIKSVKAKLSRD